VIAPFWPLLILAMAPPRPQPSLCPQDVIRTVVEALEHVDTPAPNSGIYTTYQFASPANKAITGPYGRFLRLVRNPAYGALLAHHETTYQAVQVEGDHASGLVTVKPSPTDPVTFRFILTRQNGGGCDGCWMVDLVAIENGR